MGRPDKPGGDEWGGEVYWGGTRRAPRTFLPRGFEIGRAPCALGISRRAYQLLLPLD